MKGSGYAGFRGGMRFVKLVGPRGGLPTHRLAGKIIARSGDDLVVRFDDQRRTTLIQGARQLVEQGKIQRVARGGRNGRA